MSDNCLCISSDKEFLLNGTVARLRDACENEYNSFVALNLTKQDYKAIGNCLSPEQRSYAIRLKAGSHRSRQRQRYRSIAVTSNVKVFTQKILAVTEVIFLISSVLR